MKHTPFSPKFKISAILLIAVFLFTASFLNIFQIQPVNAAINQQINYQGKLTDSSNVTVADGLYDVVFKLYTVSSGGSPIWTETRTGGNQVQVTSGLFSVMLGSVNSIDGINFNQTLYLGVTIGGDAEMTPRKILGSVPASIEAYNLGGASSTQYIRGDQTGTISSSSATTLFRLNQTGVGNAFDITSGATMLFTVLQNGNVGIGTTTPGYLLTVAGTTNISGATTLGSTLNVTGLTTLANASTTNLSISGNSFLGTVLSGSWNGTTIGTLYGGTGQTTYTDGQLLIGNSSGGTLTKSTLTGTANQVIVTNGNGSITLSAPQDLNTNALAQFGKLGIGVVADASIALIASRNSAGTTTVATIGNGANAAVDNGAIISFSSRRNTGGSTDIAAIGGVITDIGLSSYKGVLVFSTSDAAAPSEKLRIDHLGNVGIGTTTPNFLLTVGGNSNFTNALNFNGNAGTSGFVLQSQGSGSAPQWVATSSLGISGGSGLTNLNGLTASTQTFATTTTGSDFSIVSSGSTHTFNMPSASVSSRGLLTSTDWSTFNAKQDTVTAGTGLSFTGNTLNSVWTQSGNNIFNNNSANVGIGTSSPVAKLDLYGTAGSENIFTISSSTNARLLTFGANGFLGLGTSTPGSTLTVQGTSGFIGQLFDVASSSGASYLHIMAGGKVGIGTSTPNGASLVVQGTNGTDVFKVASSTGSDLLAVKANGSLVLGNLSADPASGNNGATYYNTTSNSFRCYVNSAWQACDTNGAKMILKTSDQAATSSSTTFGNDSQLKFTMATNSTYFVQASIDFDMINATADGKYTFTIPGGGATINLNGFAGISATNLTNCNIITSGNTCALAITTIIRQRINVHGIVTTSGTGGDLQFQFAQNTSTASSSPIVKSGSWISITNSTNTGGADLAELYYSKDSTIVPGDVVSLDSSINAGVSKSTNAYDKNVLGIVSTQPGLVLGLNESIPTSGTYPVQLALAGRVPVKVSTKNGPILPGDYLTSSDIPGVAMKAIQPGFVFGQAMTSYNGEEPVGIVTAFLKQTFYYSPDFLTSPAGLLKSSDPNVDINNYTNYEDALNIINGTILHSYTYKNNDLTNTNTGVHLGFTAEEVNSMFLMGDVADQMSINGLLIGSIKEIDSKINNLSASTTSAFNSNLSTIDDLNTAIDSINTSISKNFASLTNQVNSNEDSINDLKVITASTTNTVASLEIRLSSFEEMYKADLASSTSPVVEDGDIWATLQSFGSQVFNGISYLKNVFVENFTAQNLIIKGKDVTKTGFTIYDRATGQPICVYFENGKQKTQDGECEDSTKVTPQPVTPPLIDTEPPVDASSTPETLPPEDMIPEPIVTPDPTPVVEPPVAEPPHVELEPEPTPIEVEPADQVPEPEPEPPSDPEPEAETPQSDSTT